MDAFLPPADSQPSLAAPEKAAPTQDSRTESLSHAGRSKIARLPRAIREQLNRKLDDGRDFRSICEWLNKQPEVRAVLKEYFNGEPIREDNMSRWRSGGYQDHLMALERAEQYRTLAEEVGSIREEGDPSLPSVISTALSALLIGRLAKYQRMPEGDEKRAEWDSLIRAHVTLRRGDLRSAQLELDELRHTGGLTGRKAMTH